MVKLVLALLVTALLEQEALVVGFALMLAHLVDVAQFDGVLRTCFFAHSAETTPEHIDLEFDRVFFLVRPLACLDVDALGGTHGRAEHAGGAVLNPVGRLDVVLPPKPLGVLAPLLGVLNRNRLGEEHVLHRDVEALHDFDDIEVLKCVLFGFDKHRIKSPSDRSGSP
jgi:hypothetical protein